MEARPVVNVLTPCGCGRCSRVQSGPDQCVRSDVRGGMHAACCCAEYRHARVRVQSVHVVLVSLSSSMAWCAVAHLPRAIASIKARLHLVGSRVVAQAGDVPACTKEGLAPGPQLHEQLLLPGYG
jgi:hypothetical protein